jgi:hypothetical protein
MDRLLLELRMKFDACNRSCPNAKSNAEIDNPFLAIQVAAQPDFESLLLGEIARLVTLVQRVVALFAAVWNRKRRFEDVRDWLLPVVEGIQAGCCRVLRAGWRHTAFCGQLDKCRRLVQNRHGDILV